eukprot:scpid97006/ scgid23147/ 
MGWVGHGTKDEGNTCVAFHANAKPLIELNLSTASATMRRLEMGDICGQPPAVSQEHCSKKALWTPATYFRGCQVLVTVSVLMPGVHNTTSTGMYLSLSFLCIHNSS